MTYSSSALFTIASSFVEQRFTHCFAAFLTGSSVDGNFTPESDIDIGIVIAESDYQHIEMIEFQGQKIQIILLPLNTISTLLMQDYMNRKAPYLSMLAKARIIKDKNNFLAKTIHQVQQIFYAPAPPLNIFHIQRIKNTLIANIADIKGASRQYDKIYFIVPETILTLFTLLLELKQFWFISNKQALADINQHFPHIYISFKEANDVFLKTGDTSLLIAFLEKCVGEILAEPNISYTNKPGLYHISNNYFVLQVIDPFSSPHKKTLSTLINLFHCPYTYFRSLPIEDAAEKDCLYLVLFGKPNEIIDTLLISVKQKKIILGEDIQFPVNYDLEFSISGSKSFNSIAITILHTFSSFCFKENISASNTFIYALLLLKQMQAFLFDSDTDRTANFTRFCYHYWLPSAYDNGRIWGIDQLILAKERTIGLFEQHWERSADTFANLFDNPEFYIQFTQASNLSSLWEDLSKTTSTFTENTIDFSYNICDLKNENIEFLFACKNLFHIMLGVLLIPENQKSFVPFSYMKYIDLCITK